MLCYRILTLSMFSFIYNIIKSTLNFHCFATELLHFQCSNQCYPPKMLISYYIISESSFLSFRPIQISIDFINFYIERFTTNALELPPHFPFRSPHAPPLFTLHFQYEFIICMTSQYHYLSLDPYTFNVSFVFSFKPIRK